MLLAEAVLCHSGSIELLHILNRVGATAAFEIVKCLSTYIVQQRISRGMPEESVRNRDMDIDEAGPVSQAVTPQYQKETSHDVVPDYTIYHVVLPSKLPVVVLMEVKPWKMFQSLNSVAQTIGYHIVGKKTYKSASVDTHPPLGVVICESCVRFIFFPFTKNREPCVDAIVTKPITFLGDKGLDESIFSFLCYYISGLFRKESIGDAPLQLIDSETNKFLSDLVLHTKKAYEIHLETSDIEPQR